MPPIKNQPGQGISYMRNQRPTNVPYVHKAYPSMRFNADGRVFQVNSEFEDHDCCPEHEGWQKSPFPPKPIVAPPKELTAAELKIELARETAAASRLADKLAQLIFDHEELKADHEQMRNYLAEKVAEIQELKRKPAGEPPAEEPPAEEPATNSGARSPGRRR